MPVRRPDHAEAIAELALRTQQEVVDFNARTPVIGRHKYAHDLWGNAVNVASRMKSHSLPGRIQVTAAVEERLRGR